MRKSIFILCLFISLGTFLSCGDDDDNSNEEPNGKSSIVGTWVISKVELVSFEATGSAKDAVKEEIIKSLAEDEGYSVIFYENGSYESSLVDFGTYSIEGDKLTITYYYAGVAYYTETSMIAFNKSELMKTYDVTELWQEEYDKNPNVTINKVVEKVTYSKFKK